MKNNIYILLLLLPLAGCFRDSSFSEDNPKIEFSDVLEIRLTKYCAPVDTCYPPFYSLKDKNLIGELVSEINEGRLYGPWKGAAWDYISLINKKDTIGLSTNGRVFGFGNSGTFYKFKSKDFYLKYWGIKENKN